MSHKSEYQETPQPTIVERLNKYNDRNFYYCYEVLFLWFDQLPDIDKFKNTSIQSIKELKKDIYKNLEPINKEGDIELQRRTILECPDEESGEGQILIKLNYHGDELPDADNCFTIDPKYDIPSYFESFTVKKAKSLEYLVFQSDDLIKLAIQRNQKPPFLFPESRLDPINSDALEEAYNLNKPSENKHHSKKVLRNHSDKTYGKILGALEDKILKKPERYKDILTEFIYQYLADHNTFFGDPAPKTPNLSWGEIVDKEYKDGGGFISKISDNKKITLKGNFVVDRNDFIKRYNDQFILEKI